MSFFGKKKKKGGSDSSSSNTGKITKLFEGYADEDTGNIEVEGYLSLLEDLGIDDPNGLTPFVFSFKCNCKNMGKVTAEEFQTGLSSVDATTISQLKTKLSMAEDFVMEDGSEFFDFWKFCFLFLKDGEAGRKVPFAKCAVVLGLVTDKLPRAESFIEFMNTKEISHMNKDQWNSFVEFNQTVTNFDEYDETEAWPTLYDEFVDWVKNPEGEEKK